MHRAKAHKQLSNPVKWIAMIVYDLQCGDGHRFEGWFGSADDFQAQRERGLLACPACGVKAVVRGALGRADQYRCRTPGATEA